MTTLNWSLPEPPPMPQNATDATFNSFAVCGFHPLSMFVNNYTFSDTLKRDLTVNTLAFTHKTHRTAEHIGCTIYATPFEDNFNEFEAAVQLSQSSSFFHLIYRSHLNDFAFWYTDRDSKNDLVRPIQVATGISNDNLDAILYRYKDDFNPTKITNVKQGRGAFKNSLFHNTNAYQLSFWAIDITGDLLAENFATVVQNLAKSRPKNKTEEEAAELAVQLLTATILSQTGVLDNQIPNQDPSVSELFAKARAAFLSHFPLPQLGLWEQPLEEAYKILTQLRYAGFSPEMLTKLYRKTYPEQRRELGRYDTPLYLTRRIWENIPVEFLRPDERVTADMTCGWGSFLVSGYQRLSPLIDSERPLSKFIFGNERDRFTTWLARSALLLTASSDSWMVEQSDAITGNWLQKVKPNIVVGNPPFRELREKGEKGQIAGEFLDIAVDNLEINGYLAMVMPKSFIKGESTSNLARRKLLENCDIYEIWDLAEGVFEGGAETVIIFAHKHGQVKQKNHPVRVRVLERKTIQDNIDQRIFTTSGLVVNQSIWLENRRSSKSDVTHIINYRKLLPEYEWNRILSRCITLDKVAYITNGAIVGNDPDRKRWANKPSEIVKWLNPARGNLDQPYTIKYGNTSEILYPADLEEPRKSKKYPENPDRDSEHIFKNEKVLLVAKPNMSWGNRATAAIERKGYYVSNAFYAMRPRPESPHITNEVLAAVVGWYVSNAWIIEHLTYRQIPAPTVRAIPFPFQRLTPERCQVLTASVITIENALTDGKRVPQHEYDRIDSILQSAYELDDLILDRLKLVYNWREESRTTLEVQKEQNITLDWQTGGFVKAVDASNNKITFWLREFDDLQTVPISNEMPGWLLREDVGFQVRISSQHILNRSLKNVKWGTFEPQVFTYLGEEELIATLDSAFEVA